jgi:hypothetical protein
MGCQGGHTTACGSQSIYYSRLWHSDQNDSGVGHRRFVLCFLQQASSCYRQKRGADTYACVSSATRGVAFLSQLGARAFKTRLCNKGPLTPISCSAKTWIPSIHGLSRSQPKPASKTVPNQCQRHSNAFWQWRPPPTSRTTTNGIPPPTSWFALMDGTKRTGMRGPDAPGR